MSEYKFSIQANNVNKTYVKKDLTIKALNHFNINIKKGNYCWVFGNFRISKRHSEIN